MNCRWHYILATLNMPPKVARQPGMTMQTEIEMFFVTSNIQESLSNLLNSLEIISSNQAALWQRLFLTRPIWVCVARDGLRIRRSDDFSEQTIKCRGRSWAGLHARPEYNAPVEGTIPTLSAFPTDIWPSLAVRDELQSRLVAQFSTGISVPATG